MTLPAIRVEGLSKEYALGATQAPSNSLREDLINVLTAPVQRLMGRGPATKPVEHFWALKDVAFEVAPGEVIGIIGRNGAGKSTLLKILSRITAPTTGRIEVRGRIASLLEVGTGFHPELTGRENIRLNGAILGMTSAEIRSKFDEIVAFSGIETFIDTPVKHYSSGMQVRLAFAVAAHLEPEILLIDEVLAVGDAEFQRKCLGKMGEIASSGGRTVLFVSHQLGMVARLCTRTILLDKGRIAYSGATSATIDRYVAQGRGRARDAAQDPRIRQLLAAVTRVELIGTDDMPSEQVGWHEPIRLRVECLRRRRLPGLMLGIAIDSRNGTRVTTWVTPLADHVGEGQEECTLELEVEPRIIAPGGYTITAALFVPGTAYHVLEGEWPFMILDSGSQMASFGHTDYGVTIIPARWSAASAPAPGKAAVAS